ncbi:MAG: alpha/beta hydrolase, partial [Planctomycetaceae bacterium]|nr:alpha/beta hydrolase [Planctomycetaceae bacterium]
MPQIRCSPLAICRFLPLFVLLTGTPLMSAEIQKSTHVYKKAGDLEIKLDVYRDSGTDVQPVVVWIHGGALIMGNRDGIDQRVRREFAAPGTILVSLDYRLAPETQLPEIIADIEDAFRFIRSRGPELFHADPDRIAVVGGSAGGYLTLIAGYRVQPPPVALLSIYGYGNLLAPWYTQPSPHPRHRPEIVSRETALQQLAPHPVAEDRQRPGNGGKFYLYCRQQGAWPKEVTGWDPVTESEKFTPFLPIRNVTADYPPTFFIHGDKDTDVPHHESIEMSAELNEHKVENRLIILPNGEHGF